MARARRDNNARGSRNWGKISGVTIQTNPSGVTIYNSTVQGDQGYTVWFQSDAKKMTSGVLNCSGGSIDRQSCGLTTIDSVICSGSSKSAAGFTDVTGFSIACYPMHGKPFGTATQVCFIPYKLNRSGVTFSGAVSIHYIAIGT